MPNGNELAIEALWLTKGNTKVILTVVVKMQIIAPDLVLQNRPFKHLT